MWACGYCYGPQRVGVGESLPAWFGSGVIGRKKVISAQFDKILSGQAVPAKRVIEIVIIVTGGLRLIVVVAGVSPDVDRVRDVARAHFRRLRVSVRSTAAAPARSIF